MRAAFVIFLRLQQSKIFPFTTTVGTELIPYSFAFFIPFSRRSYIFTSQLGHVSSLTSFTVSSHKGHPAVKTSIFLFWGTFIPCLKILYNFFNLCSKSFTVFVIHTGIGIFFFKADFVFFISFLKFLTLELQLEQEDFQQVISPK